MLEAGRRPHLQPDGEHRGVGAGGRAALLGDAGARAASCSSTARPSPTRNRCSLLGARALTSRRSSSRSAPVVVAGFATALLVASGRSCRGWAASSPRAQRGRALHDVHPAPERLCSPRACKLEPTLLQKVRANPAVEQVMAQLGGLRTAPTPSSRTTSRCSCKPQGGKDWPEGAARTAGRGELLQQSVAEVPGARGQLQPAHPRQRERVHLRTAGPGELQALRRGPRGAAGAGRALEGHSPRCPGWPPGHREERHGGADPGRPDRTALALAATACRWRVPARLPDRARRASGGASCGKASASSTWCCGLPAVDRDDIEKIRKLRIPVDGGLTVPLEALARVGTGMGRASINRENGRRHRPAHERAGATHGSFVKGAAVVAGAPLGGRHAGRVGASSRTRSAP